MFKLSLKPKSRVTAVMPSVFYLFQFSVSLPHRLSRKQF